MVYLITAESNEYWIVIIIITVECDFVVFKLSIYSNLAWQLLQLYCYYYCFHFDYNIKHMIVINFN